MTMLAVFGQENSYCWGRNNQKQVSGQHGSSVKQPVAIDATSSYASVALGRSHSCGIKLDGTLWCWGDNGAGKLGIGTPGGSYGAPQQVERAAIGRK